MAVALQIKPYRRRFRQPLHTAHGPWVWREGLLLKLQPALGPVTYGEIAPIPWFGSETLAEAQAFCEGLVKQGTLDERHWLEAGAIPDRLPATQFGLLSARGRGPHPKSLSPRERDFEPADGDFSRDDADCSSSPLPVGEGPGVRAIPSAANPDSRLRPLPVGEGPGVRATRLVDDDRVRVCGLLPAGDTGLTTWPTLWAQGTCTFKWKIGVGTVTEELALLATLVHQMPPAARLRLDANGGLTLAEAEQWLSQCDRLNASPTACPIEFLEQPLPPRQFQAMQALSQRFQTAIALDESVATVTQLEQACHRGWRGIYIVKPAIAGSPHRLRHCWQTHAPRLVFSSAFETPIGRQAALALASAYQQDFPEREPLALGFGTLGWFDDDWDTLTPAQLWDSL